MNAPGTVQPTRTEQREVANEVASGLDSIRRQLIEMMKTIDGHEAGTHAALGNLVAGVDDAQRSLVDSQLGVGFDPELVA